MDRAGTWPFFWLFFIWVEVYNQEIALGENFFCQHSMLSHDISGKLQYFLFNFCFEAFTENSDQVIDCS